MTRIHIAAPDTARPIALPQRTAMLAFATFAAAAWYFPWRAGTLNLEAPGFSAMVYGVELFCFAFLCLQLFMQWGAATRTPRSARAGSGADIFIMIRREPAHVVRRSLVAAVEVRRAEQIFLVGGREEIAALAEEFAVSHVARRRDALIQSKADFIAVFSAEHAPSSDSLERMLGYFADAQMGFVQGALDFALAKRPLWVEIFLGAPAPMSTRAQEGRDRLNAVLMGESCAVLRRSALDRIKGFASGTAWGLRTGLRLHKAGFGSVFHGEALAKVVAPNSNAARTSFAEAAAAAWRYEGLLSRGLSAGQRLSYLAAFLSITDVARAGLFVAAPALAVWLGVAPVATLDVSVLLHLLPYGALSLALVAALRREPDVWRRLVRYAPTKLSSFKPAPLGASEHARDIAPPRERRMLPPEPELWLWAALGLSVFAMAAGATRFLVDGRPSLALLIAGSLWLAASSLIALASLQEARKRRAERRVDARVAADFAVELYLPGGWFALHALDATPDGVRLAAPVGAELAAGQCVDVFLRVAGRRAPARLRVRHRAAAWEDVAAQRLTFGCALNWADARDRDALVLALYGGDAAARDPASLFAPAVSNENEPLGRGESAA